MRTDEEILARIAAVEKHDFFGTQTQELACRLSFDAARPLLKPEAKRDDWKQHQRDADAVRAEMLDYMPFAWDKANNRRGLSAARSLDHMSAWLWLLGHDQAADAVQQYDRYGKPHLRAICEAFGWDWRQWDDGLWTNDECDDGDPPPAEVAPLELLEARK